MKNDLYFISNPCSLSTGVMTESESVINAITCQWTEVLTDKLL